MSNTNIQILPSRSRGSQVQSPDLPITQFKGQLLVDARLLHQKLQSGQEFSPWIKKRIEDYHFSETDDFLINVSKNKKKGRNPVDYLLTLDTAKEIAMLERNEIGRMIRRYFIQKEKEARGEYYLLPREKMDDLFTDIKPLNINGRVMYPFHKAFTTLGYRNAGSMYHYGKNYPNHFVVFDDMRYISRELILQIYHSRLVRLARKANKAMAPVLPQNFADPKELKGGNHE